MNAKVDLILYKHLFGFYWSYLYFLEINKINLITQNHFIKRVVLSLRKIHRTGTVCAHKIKLFLGFNKNVKGMLKVKLGATPAIRSVQCMCFKKEG